MPPKREAIALQKVVNNQEQWDEIMGVEGVMVIDIYQKWCGPCKAVVSLFKRLKNEIGDDLLHYAVAEADGIESLEKYRGRCEPCFLFFGGGQLTHVVRGTNAPALHLSITTQLTAEHKVLEEGAERKVIRDPLLAAQEEEEKAAEMAADEERRKMEDDALNSESSDVTMRGVDRTTVRNAVNRIKDGQTGLRSTEPQPKKVTVAVIKPDAVKNGLVDEIVAKMQSEGIEILAQEERTLTEDEAREFYAIHKDEEHFEDLVKFMSSGPVHTLVLTKGDTGEDIIPEVRTLIGPADVELAKEEAPGSIRAVYGTDKITNAVHAADSEDTAAMELAFFFPDFAAPIVPGTGTPPKKERTLAIIRPDALRENKDAIIDKIQEAGFEVALQKEIVLSEDQVKELYKEHEGQDYYDALVANMTSGPVLVLGLAREDAIQSWRDMLGPKEVEIAKQEAPESLRAQFTSNDQINALHGSDSYETASKEINYFFPLQQTFAVIKPDAAEEQKEAILERIREAGFNIAVTKETQMTKEVAQQLYKEHEGKEFYESLTDHMASGPSMIMVLSREDAVTGFRDIMGPTDPDVAKEQVPESLRALLGKDILQNAIHASSNQDSAVEKIKEFFPEVEFNPDGTVKVKAEEKEDEGGEAPVEGTAEEQGVAEDEGAEQAEADETQAAEGEEQAADEEEQQPADGGGVEEQKEGEESGEQAETPADTPAEDQSEQKDDEGAAEEEDKGEQQQEEQTEAAGDEEKTEEAAPEGEETKDNTQEVEGGEQKESEA